MCGIVGIYNLNNQQIDKNILRKMLETLTHRGPDGEGVFIDKNLGIGNRRLAIIDLSKAGNQPMPNENNTLWIVYNGEIYNYIELRSELEKFGHRFKSNTDTEVILHSYEEWGTDCLKQFNGMWAFAIWDKKKQELFCARDRYGIKPFYYYFDGKVFTFASEIKTLLNHPFVKRQPNDKLIFDYLTFGNLDHTSETFFANIKQLEPGHYLTVSSKAKLDIKKYYQIYPNLTFGEYNEKKCQDYAEQFLFLLKDAVRLRLRSDVPVGSSLSGGIDSSTVVCLVNKLLQEEGIDQKIIGEHQKTFTSAFEDLRFDERQYVQLVVKLTGVEPHYVFPSGERLWQELDDLIWYQEEPFNSTSVYAQWNVMRLAKENKVKVLLDGQGGDELLAGYLPYFGSFLNQMFFGMNFLTYLKELQSVKKTALLSVNKAIFYQLKELFLLFPQELRFFLRRKIKKRFNLIKKGFTEKYKKHEISQIKSIPKLNLTKKLYQDTFKLSLRALLRYEDRNSMAFSIETRLPFLDHRLVEFVFSLPAIYKIHGGWSKFLLRMATKDILPDQIRWRRDKMGFVSPEKIWLRENKEKVKEIFTKENFMSVDYVDKNKLLDNFDKLLMEGDVGISDFWKFINLELWLRKFFK